MRRSLVCIVVTLPILCVAIWYGSRGRGTDPGEKSDHVARDPTNIVPTVTGTAFLSNPQNMDPDVAQWPSEAFAARAAIKLNRLKKELLGENRDLDQFFSNEFFALVDSQPPEKVFEDATLSVSQSAVEANQRVVGIAAIEQFVQEITANQMPDRVSIKIIGVELLSDSVATVLRIESNHSDGAGALQTISRWNCSWALSDDLRIASAELAAMERVRRFGPRWFVDGTTAVIGDSVAFEQQLSRGLQFWLARIETAHGMNYYSKHGLAVADVNGDRLDDLYVCQPGGLPNRLFIQNADGTATESAQQFGLDLLDRTASAIFADLDNDGDQDAALATLMGVIIFENQRTNFQRRQVITFPDIDLQGISAVDYDNDGDLDLYQIVDYASAASRSRQGLPGFVYHDARDGGANRLLQNDGAWQFRDVTIAVGLNVNNQRHSLAAAWEDVDNDGDQDLYVANDYGPNCLYRNDNGQFVDVAVQAGVVDFGSGMSVSFGDYNRDGRIDLYVGNMFSSAGSRIAPQRQFLPNVTQQRRALYQRFAKGNSLFRNHESRFHETGALAGVEMGRWAWSSVFADLDNDGWEDLLVANGYLTTDDSGDL